VLIQLLQKQGRSVVPYKPVRKVYALVCCDPAGGVDLWAWEDLETAAWRPAFVMKTRNNGSLSCRMHLF
jgi:hypothetical protein